MNNRKLLVQRLHHTYKRDDSMKEWICFYCGSAADGQDHCPPLTLAEIYPGEDRILVRCCNLCNTLLSNHSLLTLYHRTEFLRRKYEKRWKRDLDMPHWTDNDIEELHGTLKREIIKGMKRKERAIAVLHNLGQRMEIFWEKL